LVGISTGFVPLSASAETVWKMATKMPPTSPEGKAFQVFADEVARLSKGKMKISVYPSEQLGATRATLDMLRKGTIHVYPESLTFSHVWVPEVTLAGLPFVFRDRDHWQTFMDSPRAKKWKSELAAKAGISYLGSYGDFMRGPYRVLVSVKPVLKLNDVKGMKLRMYKNEMVMNIWKELGAQVINLPYTEVYQGLKTGLVEAVTTSLAGVAPMKFQEVAKYILQTDEFPQSIVFYVNHKAYEGLPGDLQEVVYKAYKASCGASWKIIPEEGERSIGEMVLKDKAFFIRAPMDEFRERVSSIYEKWESEGKFKLKKGTLEYIKGL
jgi:tripartite ATP-independent transporter DctP family solute receptor